MSDEVETFTACGRREGLVWVWSPDALPMSRILLIPIAVILAAGGVVLGPGEQAPAVPSQTVITPSGEMGIQHTAR